MNTDINVADALPSMRVGTPRIDPAVARRIRLVCFDVDGVLTDGGIYLGSEADGADTPFEMKRYDVQDGLGTALLRDCSLSLAIITGRVSHSVTHRARELGIDTCVQDRNARKLSALSAICSEHGFSIDDVAFVGDDIPDLPVLRAVGLPVAVANAAPEVRRAAHVQLTRRGGNGAVREFAELLLEARGEWIDAVERYVRLHSVEPDSTPVSVVNT